jgi:hypothetical protein
LEVKQLKTIATVQTENKSDALKYAYAFMKSENLNLKECSFINATPGKFDGVNLMPKDMFSDSYNENVPTWDSFKNNQKHLASPGFSCVASIDKKDQKRVMLAFMGNAIMFNCYGNYEDQAKNIFEDISTIHSTLN